MRARKLQFRVRILVADDHEGSSRHAARLIGAALRRRPGLLLGLATGETPTRTYGLLAARRDRDRSLFRRVRVIKLDEWLGLPLRHPSTCETYLRKTVLGPWRVAASRYEGFASRPKDPSAECARIAAWLARRGPIDLCVLGLGTNGHLLMNEPAASLEPGPHVARLSASTQRHSMIRSLSAPPRRGLTLGMGDILGSKAVLLLVSGRHKAAAFRRMVSGTVTTRCPASFLSLHPDVTVLCDREAAGGLSGTR